MACRPKSVPPEERDKSKDNFHTPLDLMFTDRSALARAIHFENVHESEFLMKKKGCDPNKPVGDRKMRPMMLACFVKNWARRIAIFKNLINNKANPDLVDNRGNNCLMYVCAHDLKEELEVILDKVVSTSFAKKDKHGNLLLHICAKYSSIEVMNIVLRKMKRYRIDINTRNDYGHTALDLAIIHKNVECAERLFGVKGVSTMHKHKYGPTYFDTIKDKLLMEKLTLEDEHDTSSKTDLMVGGKSAKSFVPVTQVKADVKILSATSASASAGAAADAASEGASASASGEKESPHEGRSVIAPLKDSEEIVCQLLDYKSKNGRSRTDQYSGPSQQVPLDKHWIATTRSQLRIIATMERYVLESICGPSCRKNGVLDIDKALSQKNLPIPKEFPPELWKRALAENAAYEANIAAAKKSSGPQDECPLEENAEEDTEEAAGSKGLHSGQCPNADAEH